MSAPKSKGLGRGLDALLAGSLIDKKHANATLNKDTLMEISIQSLVPGKYQPRTRMDDAALTELSESIKVRGIIQPIIVRKVGDTHEILAGERRWRAAQRAGLSLVPVVIREVPDEAALGIGLIENIQREDLNPLEEAQGLRRLIDEFSLTHEQVAHAIGRSRSAVTNLLRLIELTKPVQEHLMSGRLELGHAKALLGVAHGKQVELGERTVSEHLTVREVEALVQQAQRSQDSPTKPKQVEKDADIRRLEDDLMDALGATVALKHGKKGGLLTIRYANLDQLEGITDRLKRPPGRA